MLISFLLVVSCAGSPAQDKGEPTSAEDCTWYLDADDDGYRPDSSSTLDSTDLDCTDAGEAVSTDPVDDCDDGDAAINPAAEDICDEIDNDCDGTIDSGLRVPGDQATIGDAISAASAGDIICVDAGTYAENIDFGGKDVEIVGVDGSGATTLDGSASSSPVVSIKSGETVAAVLQGFTVTGGTATKGAGIYVASSGATVPVQVGAT